MQQLLDEVESLKQSEVKDVVQNKLTSFKNIDRTSTKELFQELCYCILTANASAKKCMELQNELGECFENESQQQVQNKLKESGYRFHNRAKYIEAAKKQIDKLKQKVNTPNEKEIREWIVKNIDGIGYKEASHFLRNIGFEDVAIIDYHILDILKEYNIIEESKRPNTKKQYLEREQQLREISKKLGISLAELDLYLWYMETGNILK